jgi:GTP cyclohydrolase I
MSNPSQSPAERRLSSTSKAAPIPTRNLDNLSLLSESSTGSWERGRMHGNARSPPTQSNILSGLSPRKSPPGPSSISKVHARGEAVPSPPPTGRPSQIDISAATASHSGALPLLYARQQREGYGFRPKSGTTTPTGAASASGSGSAGIGGHGAPNQFFPTPGVPHFPAVGNRRQRDEDDFDHHPTQTMDELRAGIRDELSRGGEDEEQEAVAQGEGEQGQLVHARLQGEGEGSASGSGIADEEGLGWPGMSSSLPLQIPV